MNTLKIGQNLSAIRMQHGLTQAELAEAIGVTTSHIGHVESGSRALFRCFFFGQYCACDISLLSLYSLKRQSSF